MFNLPINLRRVAVMIGILVLVFIVLVASYDLLLGYTGIVSFAHTMFFGIGAYGVAIACSRMGPTWTALGTGVAAAMLLSLALSFAIGLFSLRVRAIFYAMITLADLPRCGIRVSSVDAKTKAYRSQERCLRRIDLGPPRSASPSGTVPAARKFGYGWLTDSTLTSRRF